MHCPESPKVIIYIYIAYVSVIQMSISSKIMLVWNTYLYINMYVSIYIHLSKYIYSVYWG